MPPSDITARVAIVYDVLYPWTIGGVEKRYWEIARRLPAYGIEPHLFGPKYWDGPRSIEREGVWLHGVGPPRPLYDEHGTRTFTEPLYYARDIVPALLRLRVDLIDCCAFPFFPWFSARMVAALHGVPIITTTPEFWRGYWLDYLGPVKGRIAKAIEYTAARFSQSHICLTPFTERRLRDVVPGNVAISPVPAGIDADALARFAAPQDQRSGVVVISRLIPHKRVMDAIEAFALVRRAGTDETLTIVGHGTEGPRLRGAVERLGLLSHVLFKAGLDEAELYTLIGNAKCLLLPSEREGQGLVVAEAQATGTPPIVAMAPESAACDFVADGVDGILYPVGDVQGLANAITGLLSDPGRRERIARRGPNAAVRLDWDAAILPKVVQAYTAVLKDNLRARMRTFPQARVCSGNP